MSEKKSNENSRRKFLRTGIIAGGAAVIGLTMGLPSIADLDKTGKLRRQLGALYIPTVSASPTIDQTGVDPRNVPKYVEPVPTFVGLRVDADKHPNLYISNAEFQQQILPKTFYDTVSDETLKIGAYVWGYSVNDGHGTYGPLYPAFTIEAKRDKPVRVCYANTLNNTQLQSYLSVDQTIHWANPNGTMSPDPYTGGVPVVTHLHGAEVTSESDGGPDAWFLPGYTKKGPAFNEGVTRTYTYPNSQEPTTLFYHDHCLGATRINLYAGLVGFYFLRDEYDTGIPGKGLKLPAGPYEIELAIQDKMLDTNGQLLYPDGTGQNSSYYTDHPELGVDSAPAGLNGPPPNSGTHPFWNPEFFGDIMIVNGKSWPYLDVEPRRYRFRLVDGCNARFLNMQFADADLKPVSVPIYVIGTDGGLLDKPVLIKDVFIAPGERLDIIIDFAAFKGQSLILTNNANAPYPDGLAVDPYTNGQIMKFNVNNTTVRDYSFNPTVPGATLRGKIRQPKQIVRLADGLGGIAPGVKIDQKRMLVLKEFSPPDGGGPEVVLVNNTGWLGIRPSGMDPMVGDPIPDYTKVGPNYLSELPAVGSTEQWDIINLTMDAHPIHLHLVQFQMINRQDFDLGDTTTGYFKLWNESFPGGSFIPKYGPPLPYYEENDAGFIGGNPDVTPFLQNNPTPPVDWEIGWKDTFKMYPNQISRIIVRWAPQDVSIKSVKAGQNKYNFNPSSGPGYVWHCHIVDHEDNEMMRPYKPVQNPPKCSKGHKFPKFPPKPNDPWKH
jgi:spore coat protein A, manganese oxidase